MKNNFKTIVLAGFMTILWGTHSSHCLELLLGGAGQESGSSMSKETISNSLISVYSVGDTEKLYPLFKDGLSWRQLYRTHDGQDLEISIVYDPREENNPFMHQLKVIEEEYANVIEHFMEEFSHKVEPGIPTYVEETSTSFSSKLEFISKTPGSKEWSEAIMKMPGFSPTELYKEFVETKEKEDSWKNNLYRLINEKSFEPFTLSYAVPANPGMLKKYVGSEHGPMKFELKKEEVPLPSGQKGKTHSKPVYTTSLNYGVFTLSVQKAKLAE